MLKHTVFELRCKIRGLATNLTEIQLDKENGRVIYTIGDKKKRWLSVYDHRKGVVEKFFREGIQSKDQLLASASALKVIESPSLVKVMKRVKDDGSYKDYLVLINTNEYCAAELSVAQLFSKYTLSQEPFWKWIYRQGNKLTVVALMDIPVQSVLKGMVPLNGYPFKFRRAS